MEVEFSDLALAGLAKSIQDDERRQLHKLAIKFFLKKPDAERAAFPCPAFQDKNIYLIGLYGLRIMYEVRHSESPIAVWSIQRLSERGDLRF
jgi:hypothetical protein